MRMPPAPLPPALGQAAVADAAKRQVGQMSAQVFGQSGGVGVTVPRVGGQALGEDVRQSHGHSGGAAELDRVHRVGADRDGAAQHLVQDQAEGVDVGAAIDGDRDRPAFADLQHGRSLLGGQVVRRPAQPSDRRLVGPDRRLGQVEVQEHRRAVGRQQDVRWLQVEVDQLALVRRTARRRPGRPRSSKPPGDTRRGRGTGGRARGRAPRVVPRPAPGPAGRAGRGRSAGRSGRRSARPGAAPAGTRRDRACTAAAGPGRRGPGRSKGARCEDAATGRATGAHVRRGG